MGTSKKPTFSVQQATPSAVSQAALTAFIERGVVPAEIVAPTNGTPLQETSASTPAANQYEHVNLPRENQPSQSAPPAPTDDPNKAMAAIVEDRSPVDPRSKASAQSASGGAVSALKMRGVVQRVQGEPKARLTTYVDPTIAKTLKMYCLENGLSVSDLIEDAVTKLVRRLSNSRHQEGG